MMSVLVYVPISRELGFLFPHILFNIGCQVLSDSDWGVVLTQNSFNLEFTK